MPHQFPPPPDPTTEAAARTAAHDAGGRTRRWLRVLAPVGVVAAALGSFAVAQAAIDDSRHDSARDLIERGAPGATSSSLPSGLPPVSIDDSSPAAGGDATGSGTTFIHDAVPDGTVQQFAAGEAGTVSIGRSGSVLTVVGATANPGWVAEVESARGPEVEVQFTATAARIDLEAELEDGGVRVRVRQQALVPATIGSTPTPDDSGRSDDDRSGPDASDRSGPGSGSAVDDAGRSDDDGDLDDDHSGSGSSDSSGSSGSGHDDGDDDHSGSGSSGSSGSGHDDGDDDHGGSRGSDD